MRKSERGVGRRVCPWLLLAAAAMTSCSRSAPTLATHAIDTPVPAGGVVPQVNATRSGGAILSWLEPRADKGYRFRVALRTGDIWGVPATIDDSPDVTMFSANLPGVAEAPDGSLVAYWERADARAHDDPYATAIQLARSNDAGQTWTPLESPHRDGVTGQHSFISTFAVGDALGLVWLDAQKQRHVHMPSNGSMAAMDEYLGAVGLRYARVAHDGSSTDGAFIDPITCECCPTAAAVTARGPVVVYRDRVAPSDTRPEDIRYETPTVRDIHLVRFDGQRWSAPHRVHADNWTINACPDNGPAVDADGNRVAVAWWTAADNQPRVSVAFSDDTGDTFGPAIRVDVKSAEGQVTVARLADGAVVGWLEDHQTWARWVGADGRIGSPVSLGPAPTHSRLPHWLAAGADVLATWTEQRDGQRTLRMAKLSL